jgi:hypothetical protein
MATTEINIWESILRPHFGRMTSETAQSILELAIPDVERARMKTLLSKAKSGRLTREESLDLDEYERAGNMLSVLKARARRVLKSKKPQ